MPEILKQAKEIVLRLQVDNVKQKILELDQIQSKGNYNDPEFIRSVKEYNTQSEMLFCILNLNKKIKDYEETKDLLSDPLMENMAYEDMSLIQKEIEILYNKIKILILKPLAEDDKKAIIEVRPGVGGVEASLFAEDLFRMYIRYCNEKGYKVENYSLEYNPEGGINEAVFLVNEDNSFSKFRFESGVHRVQRVPSTESLGRIHTSTASVVAMPKFESTDLKIDPNDLRIDVYRSSGPGGQSVNTTDSAVRIFHIPTKITVTCQNGKSQHKNKETAMSILMSKLFEIEKEKKSSVEKELRSESIKGGDRSVKIRTYNFPQGRITDHRIGKSWFNIDNVMAGAIDDIITSVNTELREKE